MYNIPISSDSLCIANDAQRSKLLIIANNNFDANRIFDEINFFSQNLNIAIFPDTEILPYERVTPQKDIIAKRLKTLWQLSLNQIDVLIISAPTLQTRLCPKTFLYQKQFIVQVGNEMSLDNLRTQLIQSNYNLVEQVYEPSEFAIRGGIIDIIPMGSTQIIRIELFGNEIESLSIIDPKTKTLIKTVENIEIIPAREYPTDPQSIKHFCSKFGSVFNQPSHLNILKEFGHGIIPAGSEFYLPLFFEETATIFDYLSTEYNVVYYSDLLLQLQLNFKEINSRYELFNYQYPCLRPSQVFIPSEDIFAKLKTHKTKILNITPLQTNIESNSVITSNNLYSNLPNIVVNHKNIDSFALLKDFINNFHGQIIIIASSIGKVEILRQSAINHGINIKQIKSLSELDIDQKIVKSPTAKNEPKIVYIIQGSLYNGFIIKNPSRAFITEQDLYKLNNEHNIPRKRKKTTLNNDLIIRDLAQIEPGDLVVHLNYGIGRYTGLVTQNINDIFYDMLEIEYKDDAKLFVPVNNLQLISRYTKADDIDIEINKLGSSAWQKIKSKAQKRAHDLAAELLEIYAKRQILNGDRFTLPSEYSDFITTFGYEPTPDQEAAFSAVIEDMTQNKPMDRLICGDVGFGKTEVAIRAAFICAMNYKQVVILAPTTILTEQHYQNFITRFANYPIRIAEVSRFKTKKQIADTLNDAALGKIDILIGTHRLIQNDIKFAKLGLVIIDEEHRFGVKQKEKLKSLRTNVDFLTLTATPIPRTLSMALDGIRDFSIIATPPKRRLSVNTLTIKDDNLIIREAILRETRRGGQVFFLYNNVANIQNMYDRLSRLVPEITITIAHGQMHENELELTLRDFIAQKYNLIICSTIIENGIDIANANTIIIYNADKFGLAQLHQLRGRVGRSHHQAYCYLITPENPSPDAKKRLEAICLINELGSGVNLAMHDLEIRGAGEILGDRQSGDIKGVGLSLYTQMLKKAVHKLKSNRELTNDSSLQNECEIDLNTSTIISDDYCHDIHERLIFYKRLSIAQTFEQIDEVYLDLLDNYGIAPDNVKALIESQRIRIYAQTFGITKMNITNSKIEVVFMDNPPVIPAKIINLMQLLKTVAYDGKNKLTWTIQNASIDDKIRNANYLLDNLK